MAAKDVRFGGEARQRMLRGVDILAEPYVLGCHVFGILM